MKKIILFLLLVCPIVINALECDQKLYSEYVDYASRISYDNNFKKITGKFNIIFYNVIDGLYFKYNNKTYYPENDQIKIEGIAQGTDVMIYVYANDNCNSSVRIIGIDEPYYNSYYNTSMCAGYENKTVYCSSQFTNMLVTRDLLIKAKENADRNAKEEKKETVVQEKSFMEKVMEFASSWGVKVALLVITSIGTFSYYNDKYRKIKHGI